ncbi:hypothetical protein GCM10022215_43730 [Nocardioides fonticola]|uniref:Big-1 domain-containing protein n=1 Tax=Nocardioides fonticola TaxID=450363 RepID=A0ABP7Y3P0_9ACTN
MNSSGIKRGLASSAIAALAVAGLPLLASSANAVALSNGIAAGQVKLVGPIANGSTISAKADGTDSTVRLTAVAASDVTAVSFQYSLDGTNWTTIGTATADDGAFAYEWNPAAVAGGTVQLRAVAGSVNSTAVTGVVVNNTANTANLTAGSAAGVFQSPDYAADGTANDPQNVIVAGTTSAAGTVNLKWYNGTTFVGTDTATAAVTAPATTGTFAGVVNINGYSYGTTDQLLLQADLGANTGADTEGYTLYKQVITTVTAAADKTNLPSGQSANITVTVKDQNGNPIAGARVGNSLNGGTALTNAKGQATFTLPAGSSASYFADATDVAGYQAALGDKQSDTIAIATYSPSSSSIPGTSTDGAAFDLDEYTAGDISVQVKDQNGNNLAAAGRTVSYYWVETPFDGSPATQRFPAGTAVTTVLTDGTGKAVIDFPSGQTDVNGTYELYASLSADGLGNGAVASSKVLTVKAGQAALKFAPADRVQGAVGSTVSVTGTLALTDGTALPGRTVTTGYNNGGGNSNIVQADGTTGNSRSYTTGTDGSFKVEIKDGATPTTAESGTLAADSTVIAGSPDAVETVDFTPGLTPAAITISNPASTTTAGLTKTYGVTLSYDSDLTTAGVQNAPLANTDVTLTLDHGFFTPNTLTPAATPAAGDDAYNLKNLGSSITVKTDGSGQATVTTTIAKDAGFDDDGLVDAKITATAGSVSASDTDTWTSASPLNGGTAAIDLAPAAFQQSTVLPDARTGQNVAFDVFVTDQYGNKVPGASVTVTGSGSLAGFSTPVNTNVTVDDDVVVNSNQLGSGTLAVSWNTKTTKYDATGAIVISNPPAGETLTDSQAVSFYAYDINTATLSLVDSASGTAPKGQAVTVTAKVVDSKGQPIQGVGVSFLRQGPGNVTDGDPNLSVSTNAKGEAYYSFIGTSAGTANVSAVFADNTGRKTLTDSIVITGASAPTAIKVTLTGDDNGGRDDKLTVTTTAKAAGADITIYKVKKNGKRGGVVATATVNNSGTTKVTVPDTNGKKSTKYVAVVSATSDTKAGTSNKKTVK